MEEKKKNNRGVAILLIVLLIAVIIGGVYVGQKYVGKSDDTEKKEPQKEPQPVKPVDKDDMAFAFLKLENNNKNFMYSPLSIRSALQILAEGAEDESRQQLDALLGEYNTNKYVPIEGHLGFGNSLFIRDTYYDKVEQDYIKLVKEKYGSEIIKDEFKSAANINKWIEDKTMGMIKDMLQDQQVTNPDVKMVIANALSIDMEWIHGFDAENTYGQEFTKKDGKKISVQMMHETFKDENLSYYVDDDVKAISLKLKQYDDIQFDVYAIMPTGDIDDFINNFNTAKFDELASKMENASTQKGGVALAIPRFDYKTKMNLNTDLMALGVENIFSQDKAHLFRIVKKETSYPLYVSEVLHDSKIEFSEKGVKAAAATVIVLKDSAMHMPEEEPLKITFNKPFIYVIKDNKTNAIWFIGAVYEPEEAK